LQPFEKPLEGESLRGVLAKCDAQGLHFAFPLPGCFFHVLLWYIDFVVPLSFNRLLEYKLLKLWIRIDYKRLCSTEESTLFDCKYQICRFVIFSHSISSDPRRKLVRYSTTQPDCAFANQKTASSRSGGSLSSRTALLRGGKLIASYR